MIDAISAARIICLGEMNHFVHEKTDFRLRWLKALGDHFELVLAEELGRSDGFRVNQYLRTGDPTWLAQREEQMKKQVNWLLEALTRGQKLVILNHALLEAGGTRILLTDDPAIPGHSVQVGHMYNTLIETQIAAQAGVVHFVPRVSPLGGPG